MTQRERSARRVWKIIQGIIANVVFGFPGRKLRVIGVTGTDGKTTTVHLIIRALESAGYTVGAISTIHFQVGTKLWTNTSKLTTPGPWTLAKLLAHMVRAGCHYVVLECSSHRLDQNGFWGIPFDVAVITNITREHFDYHRDFDDYAAAKQRLFQALRHPPKVVPPRMNADEGGVIPTVAVVNLDDDRCRAMLEEKAEKKFGYTMKGVGSRVSGVGTNIAVVAASSVADTQHPTPNTRVYVVRAGDHEALLPLKLPGDFNLQNALAAIAVGVSQGIELARITRELADVERIPGRMDFVEQGQPFKIIVDYAVTPAAFEKLFEVVRPYLVSSSQNPAPKIIHVFGATGGRDRGKRPLLGEIAARHAGLVILTDEDPYDEDPEQILDDIERGLLVGGMRRAPSALVSSGAAPRSSGGSAIMNDSIATSEPERAGEKRAEKGGVRRIRDRRLAVREALKRVQPGDVVLLTGKGAEETMAIGPRRIPWNDRRVVEEELQR